MTWRDLANTAVAALLAPTCAICDEVLDRPLDGAVCPECWAHVARFTPPLCVRCGWPLPSSRTGAGTANPGQCRRCGVALPGIAAARAVGPFDGRMVDVVHALKYQRRPSVSGPLAALMRQAAWDLLREVDLVVPVPLHPRRERERGFNQAAMLAAGLGPPLCMALRRTAITAPQASLTGRARRDNVRHAFDLARDARLVAGRRVALVDDVLTTGATLAACASMLAGAAPLRIVAVTAARAERGPRA